MIKPKKKICSECQKESYIFSKGRCKPCAAKSYGKPKPVGEKRKKAGGTGELDLFLQIYKEVGGKCEISGEWIPFNPANFMHLLSKGTRPDLRLERNNIRHVKFDYHFGYDHVGKDIFLKEYPEAAIIYQWKEEIKK